MFIMHIALQGCLKPTDVDYGITPDTGGHIKYLLELVESVEDACRDVVQEVIVRRFDDVRLGMEYAVRNEPISARSAIVRIDGSSDRYLPKEDLRSELPALTRSLKAHIQSADRLPDIIHAHYADAGWLASEMKKAFGIPYMFTAHSLGRVKQDALDGRADEALSDRIAIEERAIGGADRIVASSLDEAELQYGQYRSARSERIRVNPPGCDLKRFRKSADISPDVCQKIERFLHQPHKPAIFALSRPVRKKNLAGLVRAYGQSPQLQAQANLIIVAGTRGDIHQEEGEARRVLIELLYLIDKYDLWGKVALPKTHEPWQVPQFYEYVRASRGIFVNVAFNEPFGLTFLEAAASGVPVVATNSGGPNDIVGWCGNGVLVDPRDTGAIQESLLALLTDRERWEECSRSGLARSARYDWKQHAGEYLADIGYLAAPIATTRPEIVSTDLLVCDIDNTLTGCRNGIEKLHRWLAEHPHCAFAIATGRSLHSALDVIRAWNIPTPSILITSVGSEIYYAPERHLADLHFDRRWMASAANWPRRAVEQQMHLLDGLRPQPEREQRPCKLSYFIEDKSFVPAVSSALKRAGLSVQVIHSHERFLDILPANMSKGTAVRHVARGLKIPIERVYAAGDSGNDIQMLETVGRAIIVANHSDELAGIRDGANIYVAKQQFAAGVVEGIERFWQPGPA